MTATATDLQRPEGALIARKLATHPTPLTQLRASQAAGISTSRWKQVVSGFTHHRDGPRPVVAPPETLARMARAVAATPDELVAAGRPDAAELLAQATAPPAHRRRASDHQPVAPWRPVTTTGTAPLAPSFSDSQPSSMSGVVLGLLASTGTTDPVEQALVLQRIAMEVLEDRRARRAQQGG